jgi:hypothetical protein
MLVARRTHRSLLRLLLAVLMPIGLVASPAHGDDPAPTTTQLTFEGSGQADPPRYEYQDPYVLVAKVTSPAATPTGTVTFIEGDGQVLGNVQVGPDGVARINGTADRWNQYVTFHAEYHATGDFADSADAATALFSWITFEIVPEPTIARIGPGLNAQITLTMAAHLRGVDRRPLAGHEVIFSLFGSVLPRINGAVQPFAVVACKAVTDVNGFATCRSSGTAGALLSVLAGGSWVNHLEDDGYQPLATRGGLLVAG